MQRNSTPYRELAQPTLWVGLSYPAVAVPRGFSRCAPLQCELPQGSPASPILYLLYTEPIYRLRNPKGRFGYADDTAILCVGNTLEETARKASRHVRELVDWGTVNAITFDPKKTEVMHFSRTKLRSAPPVFHGEVKKRPESALRWAIARHAEPLYYGRRVTDAVWLTRQIGQAFGFQPHHSRVHQSPALWFVNGDSGARSSKWPPVA